jgi:hypothetical protein
MKVILKEIAHAIQSNAQKLDLYLPSHVLEFAILPVIRLKSFLPCV